MAFIQTKTLALRATKAGPEVGETALREPLLDGDYYVTKVRMDDANWRVGAYYNSGYSTFYARDYVLNTKFVIDAEAHPTVGCVVTLTSGKTKHVDLDVVQVLREGNRR